jgi:hypothetical protein
LRSPLPIADDRRYFHWRQPAVVADDQPHSTQHLQPITHFFFSGAAAIVNPMTANSQHQLLHH